MGPCHYPKACGPHRARACVPDAPSLLGSAVTGKEVVATHVAQGGKRLYGCTVQRAPCNTGGNQDLGRERGPGLKASRLPWPVLGGRRRSSPGAQLLARRLRAICRSC